MSIQHALYGQEQKEQNHIVLTIYAMLCKTVHTSLSSHLKLRGSSHLYGRLNQTEKNLTFKTRSPGAAPSPNF